MDPRKQPGGAFLLIRTAVPCSMDKGIGQTASGFARTHGHDSLCV